MVETDRGQAIALEGMLASILLVLCLVFALQITAVTPLTESTSSQHIENQQRAIGEDLLANAAEDGTLKTTLLYWNDTGEGHYINTTESGVYHNDIPTAVGDELEQAFSDRGIAYNLRVNYVRGGELRSEDIAFHGEPSDHAVTARQTMTLYDSDRIEEPDRRLDEAGSFYIDKEGAGPIYNVVHVELVIWRM